MQTLVTTLSGTRCSARMCLLTKVALRDIYIFIPLKYYNVIYLICPIICGCISESIVMTPTKKTSRSTTIKMERVNQKELNGAGIVHTAGGEHKGIIISKESHGAEGKKPLIDNELPSLFVSSYVQLLF